MRNIEFINAGAGTGKTYTLEHLLADYMNGEKGLYQPEEIIITTFTESAAAEIKERSRKKLLEKELYEKAARFDGAAIGTVHSVAFEFVRKYWYLLGRGPSDRVMSENDKQFYIDLSLADIVSEEDILSFYELREKFNFTTTEDNKQVEDPDYWKSHLKNIIGKVEQYRIEETETSSKESKKIIEKIFNKKCDFDEKEAKDILNKYIEICGAKARKEQVEGILKLRKFRYADLMNLSSLKPTNKEKADLPGIDKIVSKAAKKVRSTEYGEQLSGYIAKIFDLANSWREEYTEFKKKNRLIDFNDMEVLFLELLENKTVENEIKGKYKLIFVDEFQDSSPIQLKIFDKLSELVEKSIWVGDPKQAIYGFRGSDAVLIKAITNIFNTGDTTKGLKAGKPLGTSYRSREVLVELSNEVFLRAFSDIKADKVKLQADRKKQNDSQLENELNHWHFVKESSRANNTDKYTKLVHKVQALIKSDLRVYDKDLKIARNIKPEDIAVLCRTNRQRNTITSIFNENGIKTTGRSMYELLHDTAEFALLNALMNYILDTSNDQAKAEILYLSDPRSYDLPDLIKMRTEFIQQRKKYIKNQEKNGKNDLLPYPKWEKDNQFIKKIEKTIREIKSLPVPNLLESLIIRLDLKSLVSAWGDKERRIGNLEAIQKLAAEYDQRCLQTGLGASLNNFIVFLDEYDSDEKDNEKKEGFINVSTYHKAKGLEWHVVILESLDTDDLKDDELIKKSIFGVQDVLIKEPTSDNPYPERYIQLLPWFLGSKRTIPDDIKEIFKEDPIFDKTRSKIQDEIKRLMYVGVTRARDYLITTSYHNQSLKWLENIGCKEITPGECKDNEIDLWDTPYKSKFILCENDPDFMPEEELYPIKVPKKPEIRESFEKLIVNPSQIETGKKVQVELLKDFEKRIPFNAEKRASGENPSDAEIGNCLHNFLCVYDPGSNKNREKLDTLLKNLLMQSVFPEPESIVKAAENFYKCLEEAYGKPIQIYKELPVQMRTKNGQFIRGTCDMVWETEKGCIVIDHKSYQGGKKQILIEGNDHFAGIYAGQLESYADILNVSGKTVIAKLIHYPVSGLIVELRTNK